MGTKTLLKLQWYNTIKAYFSLIFSWLQLGNSPPSTQESKWLPAGDTVTSSFQYHLGRRRGWGKLHRGLWPDLEATSLVAQMVKVSAYPETRVWSLGREDPLEKKMATLFSTLAWKIPWTEKPVGYNPWGHKESDTTEQLHFLSFFLWKCHIWSHWPERSCTPSTRVWVRLENVVFLFVQEKEVGWAGISLWHTHCIRQVSCSKQMAHLTGILNLMEMLFYRGVNGVKRIFEGFWHIQGLAKTGSLYLPCLWGL